MKRFSRFFIVFTVIFALAAAFTSGADAAVRPRKTSKISAMGKSDSKSPDFAFPEKVTKQSETDLRNAIASGNDPAAVSALINLTLAQVAVSADRIPASIARVEKELAAAKSPAMKAVLNSLLARIYLGVYNDNRWKYDRRELPLTPLPDDITEWSGDQFRARITELVDASLTDPAALQAVPLREWEGPVEVGREELVYYPTLYDFIAARAISDLTSILPSDFWVPLSLLARADLYVQRRMNASSPQVEEILSLYADLLRFHASDTAPFILADLNRIEFVADHVYASGATSPQLRETQLFMALYDRFRSSEYSGDILRRIPFGFSEDFAGENAASEDTDIMRRRYYDALETNIRNFPAYSGINCLKNRLAELREQSVTVDIPEFAAPGSTVKMKVRLVNVRAARVNIYDVSESDVANENYQYRPSAPHKLLVSVPVGSTSSVPFATEVEAEVTFPKSGNYIAVPVIDGVAERKETYTKIHVTRLSVASSCYISQKLWVIDPVDGAPVSGASLTRIVDTGRDTRREQLGKTNADGWMDFTTDRWCKVIAAKADDRFAAPFGIWSQNTETQKNWQRTFDGYTSLALYHPGDSVEWMAVVYEYCGRHRRVVPGFEVTARLRNASFEKIDEITLKTDEFGRIHGSWNIPKESMTGNFTITLDNLSGRIGFTVSDYKLPTYKVFADPVEKDVPEKGAVTLHGRLMTYSGFPLADTRVTVDLSAQPFGRWWWNPSPPVTFFSTEVTSGTDGSFAFVVPASVLADSPVPDGLFSASFTALSSTGESQTADIRFSTGTRYIIDASLRADYDISRPVKLPVRVVDCNDSIVDLPLRYRVISGTDTVASGVLPASGIVDFSALKSGSYQLEFSLADSSLADKTTSAVVLYRPSDKNSPVPSRLLWYPFSDKMMLPDGKGEWLCATGSDTHLLMTVTSDTGIISQKWIKAPAGMRRLPISLPDGTDRATVSLNCTGNYRSESVSFAVERTGAVPSIEFVIESFRDRLLPGSSETWTFRVKDNNGAGVRSAVILDMYNQALDALQQQSWGFYPRSGYVPGFSFRQGSLSGNIVAGVSAPRAKTLDCNPLEEPEFQLWGMDFGSRVFHGYIRGRKMRTLAGTTNGLLACESAMEDAVEYDAAPLAAMAVSEYKEEITDMVEEKVADAGAGAAAPDKERPFSYRDSETPLAFFRPMLTTEPDGSLAFSFTVPNANTTWQFNAVAFTDSLLSATASRTVLASKPVMVQPNLPRFLRTGDDAVILASVMNNSDSVQTVKTVVELFDAVTGRVNSSQSFENVIEPAKSATVSTSVRVTAGAPFIGYRIKSSTPEFADGEQTLIPVEPSVTPVIETIPFYMQPDSAEFSLRLPEMKSDARVTLQFCENPAWYVVTALPGLLDYEPSTANDAAASIFSAAIADGLMRSNPAIADALKEWSRSDRSDSTLVSMLERNADLKIVLLSATPWMMDARSDTERMTRLSLLFDKKQISGAYSAAVSLLKRLERRGGGWAWYDKCSDPSLWSTENVLLMMGRLARLGYLPSDKELGRMISSALGFVDAENVKIASKYPESDFTLYTYLRQFFPDKAQSASAAAISSRTVQRIVAGWKKGSVFDKAIYSLILTRNGNRAVAAQILESLRQYSETSPAKGMWWPSLDRQWFWSMDKVGTTAMVLDAFREADPGCREVDLIRQWLILQKEASNWGTSVTANEVISSILASSGRWIAPAQGSEITVGGTPVVPGKVERITGYFRTDISSLSPSGKQLEIRKKSDAPSWGAVYCQYSDNMTNVKASSCEALSVEKKLFLVGAGNVISDAPASLAVGQKIRVQLTVKADRDMEYVAIVDDRPACFEPVEQLPKPMFVEGVYLYRENHNTATKIFVDRLPRGTYLLTYDMWVNNAGAFSSGIATAQSQYAPQLTAHSSGSLIKVAE